MPFHVGKLNRLQLLDAILVDMEERLRKDKIALGQLAAETPHALHSASIASMLDEWIVAARTLRTDIRDQRIIEAPASKQRTISSARTAPVARA